MKSRLLKAFGFTKKSAYTRAVEAGTLTNQNRWAGSMCILHKPGCWTRAMWLLLLPIFLLQSLTGLTFTTRQLLCAIYRPTLWDVCGFEAFLWFFKKHISPFQMHGSVYVLGCFISYKINLWLKKRPSLSNIWLSVPYKNADSSPFAKCDIISIGIFFFAFN